MDDTTLVNPLEERPKKSKKKNRRVSENPVNGDLTDQSKGEKRKIGNDAHEGETVVVKKAKKKSKKRKKDNEADEVYDRFLDDLNADFEERDLATLLDRIGDLLPENDDMSFKNRMRKIDWIQVAFKGYSPKVCHNIWIMIQRKLRQNRILKELLSDAREWVNTEWKQNLKPNIHPDFPQRPVTSAYLLFFAQAKKHILHVKPDMEEADVSKVAKKAYKSLEPQKIAVFETAAAENKRKYKAAVEAFYRVRPDLQTNHQTEKEKLQQKGQLKPITPFSLYVKDQIAKRTEFDPFIVKEACKQDWKAMDDKQKVHWIDLALELEKKYFDEVHKDPSLGKSILSKQEWKIKELLAGKPQKPPNSAYGLFTQSLIKTNKLGDVTPQEKIRKIAASWKELSEEDKNQYKNEAAVLMEDYKIQLENYNKTLMENKDADVSYTTPIRKPMNTAKSKEQTGEETHNSDTEGWQNEPMELLGAVIPQTWMEMGQYEKSMYVKYIQKIKNYFDEKHANAAGDEDDEEEASENETVVLSDGENDKD